MAVMRLFPGRTWPDKRPRTRKVRRDSLVCLRDRALRRCGIAIGPSEQVLAWAPAASRHGQRMCPLPIPESQGLGLVLGAIELADKRKGCLI